MSLWKRWRRHREQLACRDLVELVTDYLELTLEPSDRARVEEHLAHCGHCARYVRQIRLTIEITGRLVPADLDALDPEVRDSLLGAFREANPHR